MRIAINAVSATAGGARTYLLNLARVLPTLASHKYLLYAPSSAAADLSGLPSNFRTVSVPWAERRYPARLVWEQFVLPRQVRRWGADALVCVGNFCPLLSSVPVVLLSRNPTYFTPHYMGDLLQRRHYAWALRHLAQIRLALWSARAARITITPTDAMGDMIRSLAGHRPPRLRTVFHGFQLWAGLNGSPLAAPPVPPPFRFLVLSHYNYFRNFETVFRAMAALRDVCGNTPFELHLTTQLRPGLRLGGYDTTRACRLIDQLGIRNLVTTLGAVPYDDLPRVYGSAHAVICPAYTESFSHTVVEAMALGVPVIASDIAVHREVAGDAALFFSALDPQELAARCRLLMADEGLRAVLQDRGRQRARSFSWRRHFEELLGVVGDVITAPRAR